MWLLEVPQLDCEPEQLRLKLVEFPSSQLETLEYAILSHTWTNDEVLFGHIQNGTAQTRMGYQKVHATILQARLDGFDFLWIDSCCIQKSSSAELQEAINSMWIWYRDSAVCYIHLEDVEDPVSLDIEYQASWLESFQHSRYFTRGWTLQELIAPRRKIFFSRTWTAVGQIVKPDPFLDDDETLPDLTNHVSLATRIDQDVLQGKRDLQSISIATRMSWMAGRKCSREEDQAYSLLGIFDVSIPLLYGEGSKAFKRLQEEILRQSDDTSIFRWEQTTYKRRKAVRGLLADSADCFMTSQFVDGASFEDRLRALPYSLTNKGLAIQLPMRQVSGNVWLGVLDCQSRNQEDDLDVIYLWRLLEDAHHFVRIFPHRLASISQPLCAASMQILVRQGIEHSGLWDKGTLSTDGLEEAWLAYYDAVSHVTICPSHETTTQFDLEYSRRKLARVNEDRNIAIDGICQVVSCSGPSPASHGPFEFAFRNQAVAVQSSATKSTPSAKVTPNELFKENSEALHREAGLDEQPVLIEDQSYWDDLIDHSFEDAVLLSQAIQQSNNLPHMNNQCITSHKEELSTWQYRSLSHYFARSELCLLFKDCLTSDRVAVIVSRERDAISIRAVPVGDIVNTYDVELDGTQIRFADDAENGGQLQVHMALRVAIKLHGGKHATEATHDKPSSHLPAKVECRACADLAMLLKQKTHRLGRRGRLSLLGDCHQSERQITLTVGSAKKKKVVGFDEEVVEI